MNNNTNNKTNSGGIIDDDYLMNDVIAEATASALGDDNQGGNNDLLVTPSSATELQPPQPQRLSSASTTTTTTTTNHGQEDDRDDDENDSHSSSPKGEVMLISNNRTAQSSKVSQQEEQLLNAFHFSTSSNNNTNHHATLNEQNRNENDFNNDDGDDADASSTNKSHTKSESQTSSFGSFSILNHESDNENDVDRGNTNCNTNPHHSSFTESSIMNNQQHAAQTRREHRDRHAKQSPQQQEMIESSSSNRHHHQRLQQQDAQEVIDLLDDDDDEEGVASIPTASMTSTLSQPLTTASSAGMKRPLPQSPMSSNSEIYPNHRATTMNGHAAALPGQPIVPGSSLPGYNQYHPQQQSQRILLNGISSSYNTQLSAINQHYYGSQQHQQPILKQPKMNHVSQPTYIDHHPGHVPTWTHLLPPVPQYARSTSHSNPNNNGEKKNLELSLLNVSEFTITGLPVGFSQRPSSVLGFRKIIKEVSRGHGKAIFERDKDSEHGPDGGKWRIPLGAYRSLFAYLVNDPYCDQVIGIPEHQLKIASLGKARLDKGYPSMRKILSYGVPKGLASALAPFQRGGVEFVLERHGRALIADEMGLGKTIQAIAGMSMYHDEWPLLVLSPSSARYHWENEFQQWLGFDSPVNQSKKTNDVNNKSKDNFLKDLDNEQDDEDIPIQNYRKPMEMLDVSEIHVLTTGKENIFPYPDIKVVICSYGLAPTLVETGKIRPGMFKCAIVDESHMLKNMNTKRTSRLIPVLHATNRCLLLSGTPALARPTELWPQLKILSTERDRWWDNETEFVRKYVQRTSAVRRAELHTLLTGTVMIRRMKHDILKSLPSKRREKAVVNVATNEMRQEFHKCMEVLREGKGVMAKLARKQSALPPPPMQVDENTLQNLKDEYNQRYLERIEGADYALQSHGTRLNPAELQNFLSTYEASMKQELDVWYHERLHELQNGLLALQDQDIDRKAVLNRMYSLTGKAKISLIANMVKKWLDDPTKGKLCVFAHHIFVLDEIQKEAGLSNAKGSNARYIRIDGSTSPRERQAQIKAFQTDPSIRIAVLGITAAGVAVTLTASSTVWFAELFWTPALMIQAEDRVHRIGQNALVSCLYFVAEGTLDVLLWDLLEKKFRDLGEFVEGKEKMKIVVRKVYKSTEDVESIFKTADDYKLDEDNDNTSDQFSDTDENGLIKLESDLEQDISQLAQEEIVMFSQEEEEDGADTAANGSSTPQKNQPKSGLGQTEEEAICLLDDDDNDENGTSADSKPPPETSSSQSKKPNGADREEPIGSLPENPTGNFDFSKPLTKSRLYMQTFEGSSFGITLYDYKGRVVVAENRRKNAKPATGDILVMISGKQVPRGIPVDKVTPALREILTRGRPVELGFVEDEDFARHFSAHMAKMYAKDLQSEQMLATAATATQPPAQNGDVIELLDDD